MRKRHWLLAIGANLFFLFFYLLLSIHANSEPRLGSHFCEQVKRIDQHAKTHIELSPDSDQGNFIIENSYNEESDDEGASSLKNSSKFIPGTLFIRFFSGDHTTLNYLFKQRSIIQAFKLPFYILYLQIKQGL